MVNRIANIQPSQSEARSRELLARLLGRLVRATPAITIEPVVEGDVAFDVKLPDLRTTKNDFKRTAFYRTTTLSNFLAEILIRQNIGEFTNLIAEFPSSELEDAIYRYDHNHAGLGIASDRIRLKVHLSLVHRILNEEIRLLLSDTE